MSSKVHTTDDYAASEESNIGGGCTSKWRSGLGVERNCNAVVL